MTAKDRRKTAHQRAHYDQVPIERVDERQQREQRRRFAAHVCGIALLQVDDDLATRVVAFALACKAEISTIPRPATRHYSTYTYLDRYLGLSGHCLDSAQIAASLDVAPTIVRNALGTLCRMLRVLLPLRDPALAVLVASLRGKPLRDDAAFWARAKRDARTGCLLWTGATDLGYGVLKRNKQKLQAHRYAYVLAHGPITPGMHIFHACGMRRCIAPEHLVEAAPGAVVALKH
jgi:hypothetical protein